MMVFLMALAGCSGAANESNSETTTPSAFRVAMVLPEPIDDQSWSQSGYEGLQQIAQEFDADVLHTANTSEMSEAEIIEILRQYAAEGYDFVIGHGGQYIPLVEAVAEEFPRTNFAMVGSYAGNNKNFAALSFRDGELGYLTGVVAALKTQTNKVAYIGGEPYRHVQERATLFERGAKATKPEIEVSVAWVESWTDADKTREISQELIEDGVDVLLINVNEASRAGFAAAESAGVYAMAWSVDEHEVAPDTILTSGLQNMSVLLVEGARLAQQGLWEGKQYKFGLREGAIELAPFYGLLTPEEEETVNGVKQDILTGKIEVDPILAP